MKRITTKKIMYKKNRQDYERKKIIKKNNGFLVIQKY